MKLVVDTNIVFSALLNSGNSMAEILLNPNSNFEFFAPNHLALELERHQTKLSRISSLSPLLLGEATRILFNRITFISEDLIDSHTWEVAYKLTKGIDEDDTPFVALALSLKAQLWTGDMKLLKGLRKIDVGFVVNTDELVGGIK